MVILERRKRKGPVLTPSSLPCLGRIPTINISAGCVHGCEYCYAQYYHGYPGPGRIVLYDNIPELVRAEILGRRRRPERVYFSSSSDAFQPVAELQDLTFQTMSILLGEGVEVAFLTKGIVADHFISLFSRSPELIFAQIGMTTLDDRLWQMMESGAASPAQRLANVENLTGIGVATQVRLDPLIADVTDTEENISPLLKELQARGIRRIAASYLFSRPGFNLGFKQIISRAAGKRKSDEAWQKFADGVGGGVTILTEERRRRFAKLAEMSEKAGIEFHICGCKNPGLGDNNCQIAGPATQSREKKEIKGGKINGDLLLPGFKEI